MQVGLLVGGNQVPLEGAMAVANVFRTLLERTKYPMASIPGSESTIVPNGDFALRENHTSRKAIDQRVEHNVVSDRCFRSKHQDEQCNPIRNQARLLMT